MSTYVYGYRSPDDDEHQKHLKVLRVCREVGVSLPDETSDYFDGVKPEYIDPDCTLKVRIPFMKSSPVLVPQAMRSSFRRFPKVSIKFDLNIVGNP
jgi:hypothetical protein